MLYHGDLIRDLDTTRIEMNGALEGVAPARASPVIAFDHKETRLGESLGAQISKRSPVIDHSLDAGPAVNTNDGRVGSLPVEILIRMVGAAFECDRSITFNKGCKLRYNIKWRRQLEQIAYDGKKAR